MARSGLATVCSNNTSYSTYIVLCTVSCWPHSPSSCLLLRLSDPPPPSPPPPVIRRRSVLCRAPRLHSRCIRSTCPPISVDFDVLVLLHNVCRGAVTTLVGARVSATVSLAYHIPRCSSSSLFFAVGVVVSRHHRPLFLSTVAVRGGCCCSLLLPLSSLLFIVSVLSFSSFPPADIRPVLMQCGCVRFGRRRGWHYHSPSHRRWMYASFCRVVFVDVLEGGGGALSSSSG